MKNTAKMPVAFIGHGSPMNALANNVYTQTLAKLAQTIPQPQAILCISAHWNTRGTFVTHAPLPRTIHDFYGFPKPLFEIRYPAPGSPKLAEQICQLVPSVKLDTEWGLDHGTWSVLRHMYPGANIPVLQLSQDIKQPGEYHLNLAQKLQPLREQGVLILGSGNIVHNLQQIQWEEDAPVYSWATEFDTWAKEKLLNREDAALAKDYTKTEAGQLSVPTADHYYPMLYALGAAEPSEKVSFVFEGMQNASISMRSFLISDL